MNAIAPIQQFQQEIQAQHKELKSILPDHLPVERFIKTAMIAIQSNPDLLNADRQSLFTSLQRCAGDGLVPDNREAALVQFNTNVGTRDNPNWVQKIQYMPMVDGVLKRARQSGEVSVITARAVHQNDQFDYWVDEDGEHLKHRPNFAGDRGPMILVYAMARMKTGDVIVEPMTMADVEKVRSASKTGAYGPWKDWFERMALKSALHRLARRLPNSSEIMEMLGNDNWMYEFNNRKERDITPREADQPQALPHYPAEDFAANFPKWAQLIQAGKKSGKQIIDMVASKAPLTEEQAQQVLAVEQGE
ncbi:recombinase RecT [Alcanivorax sp. DP30]|uniref:recombinase RecT n=1 Tax=Alcanivorax sp. DP30 TaxID=2606217 RepID=UPI00136AE073|nr:recombinase RecT [Alcanivorax sp. DP30]MZR63823.1 rect protein [Alcanivorax sp. DP30]